MESRQFVQAAEPVVSLYFPAAHLLQAFPSGPVYPATQKQFVTRELPTGDVVPEGQLSHDPTALSSLYFPATQDTQSVSEVLVQNAVLVPPGQVVQLPWPVVDLYVPLAHAVQRPESNEYV